MLVAAFRSAKRRPGRLWPRVGFSGENGEFTRVFCTNEASQGRVLSACGADAIENGHGSSRNLALGGKILKQYTQLSKIRLSTLVAASASSGFMLAGCPVDAYKLGAVTLGVLLQSASANTFNQVYERNTDALMNRTRARPLPSQRMSISHALAFGAISGATGTSILLSTCSPLSAGLGIATWLLYTGVYTPLKQKSKWNTQVGSIVGALPPLIGYTAATGSLSIEALILAAGLYFWQLPHFYALAWMHQKDYITGGHQMLSKFDPSGMKTANALMRHTIGLSSLPLISYAVGITSVMFPIESLIFNGLMIKETIRFKVHRSIGNARRVFKASLLYLPVFMILLVFHKKGWAKDDEYSLASSLMSGLDFEVDTGRYLKRGTYLENNQENQAHESPEPLGFIDEKMYILKGVMRQYCIHEYLSKPPLSRQTKTSLIAGSLDRETASVQSPFCPVGAAKDVVEVFR